MRYIISTLLLILFISLPAISDERAPGFYGMRLMGMGRAFVGVADGPEALYHNPAGLVNAKQGKRDNHFYWESLAMNNHDFIKAGTDIMNIADKIKSADDRMGPFAGLDDDFRNFYKYNYTFRLETKILYYNTRFGFGYFGHADGMISPTPEVIGIPQVEYDFLVDSEVRVAAAKSFELENKLGNIFNTASIGLGVKYIDRGKLAEKLHASELINYSLADLPQIGGQGWGGDVGFLFSTPQKINLGIVVTDIGSTKIVWTKKDTLDRGYGLLKTNMTIGLAYKPGSKGVLKNPVIALDVSDLLVNSTFGKRIHIGAEIGFTRVFKFRGGFNQGYPTAGMSIDLAIFHIDYALYGEELGKYVGQMPSYSHVVALRLGM